MIAEAHKKAKEEALRDTAVVLATADDPLLSAPVWHIHPAP